MRLINLTPHTVHIITSHGTLTLPSSGVARVEETVTPAGVCAVDLDEVERPLIEVVCERRTYGGVTGLPDYSDGVGYVVSAMVAQAIRDTILTTGRTTLDLYTPGAVIRDAGGRVVGCSTLTRHIPRPV